MRVRNVKSTETWFRVLDTTMQSQTATMTLRLGGKSSEELNVHRQSDQVVLVLAGEIEAEVGGEKLTLKEGDTCIIPAGTPHRLVNTTSRDATAFGVYAPPEYPANELS